jgi:hypothetical protein
MLNKRWYSWGVRQKIHLQTFVNKRTVLTDANLLIPQLLTYDHTTYETRCKMEVSIFTYITQCVHEISFTVQFSVQPPGEIERESDD